MYEIGDLDGYAYGALGQLLVGYADSENLDDLAVAATMILLTNRLTVAERIGQGHPSFDATLGRMRADRELFDRGVEHDVNQDLKDELDMLIEHLKTDEFVNDYNVRVLVASIGAYLDRTKAGSEESELYCDLLNNFEQEELSPHQLALTCVALWFSDYHGSQAKIRLLRDDLRLEETFRRSLLDDSVGLEELEDRARPWAAAYMRLANALKLGRDKRSVFIAGCFDYPEIVYERGGNVPAEFLCREIDITLSEDPSFREVLLHLHEDEQLASNCLLEFAATYGDLQEGDKPPRTMSWWVVHDHVKDLLGIVDEKKESPGESLASAPAQEEDEDPDAPSGGCYVATAVYGSYDCPEVWVLRRYRDQDLASTVRGRAFVRAYYLLSPVLVRRFGGKGWFKGALRPRLDALVSRLKAAGYSSEPYEDRVW